VTRSVVVLPGDGIGPEVSAAAVAVLRAVAEARGEVLDIGEHLLGGAAIDATGSPLPDQTLEACQRADAVLLGAVGGPRWDTPGAAVRPEQGLLGLRKALGLFANLRPIAAVECLLDASPLRAERVRGADVLFVRELTGGIYFGAKERRGDLAVDTCEYSVAEVERVVRVAAGLARGRSGRLTSVDKANVLETSRLWREVTVRVVAEEFPEVQLEHVLVDAMAMHMIQRPSSFDVVVTENMFGDILTDLASVLTGSLGMLPSASLGEGARGLYEPIHGSAPDIAGRGIANPCGAIASVALLLRHSLAWHADALAVEGALREVLAANVRTPDLGGTSTTTEVTEAVLTALDRGRAARGAPQTPEA